MQLCMQDSFGHPNTSHNLKAGLPQFSHGKFRKHHMACGKDIDFQKRQCLW